MTLTQVGRPAPPFSTLAYDPALSDAGPYRTISLSDYQGRWLVFFWYPLDFTLVCPTEIMALSDEAAGFEALDCALLGASTDSVYSHKAWAAVPRTRSGIESVRFPLLSDMTHRIAADYGALVAEEGVALRALFIIDPDGAVQFATVTSLNVGRSVTETLRVLQALQSGGLCPSDWKPGQRTLANP